MQQVVKTKELAAMAFAAFRLNNGIIKHTVRAEAGASDVKDVISNKEYIHKMLCEGMGHLVTDADHKLATEAIDALIQDELVMKVKGQVISLFNKALVDLVRTEETTSGNAVLISYLPAAHSQIQKVDTTRAHSFTSQHLGEIGTKVTFDLDVISSFWLQQYDCYSVFGSDGNGNLVRFLTSKKDCTISGKYVGKIKKAEVDGSRFNAKVTILHYVKAVDK